MNYSKMNFNFLGISAFLNRTFHVHKVWGATLDFLLFWFM